MESSKIIPVLESCERVLKDSQVKIDTGVHMEKLAQKIYDEIVEGRLVQVADIYSNVSVHPREKNEKTVNWIFAVDSLNFCFWGTDKHWEVTWRGETYSGYYALCAAINKAIDNGIDMSDPNVYSKLTILQLKEILKGDNDIMLQLIDERLKSLQDSGLVLIQKFNGSFSNCVKECEKSARHLLEIIVSNFKYFKDEAVYDNNPVSFYKRAQIVIGDLWSCFNGKDFGEFHDIDYITMFADYRVPQVLCYFDVLQYPDSLMIKLIEGTLLESGSAEEIEIRAASVVAVHRLKDKICEMLAENGKIGECNSILIDQFLYTYRRKNAKYLEFIPFHKSVTIYY